MLEENLLQMKLLYVEDDDGVREIFMKILETKVKEIIVAVNGEEGLKAFHEHQPDIVVTDIRMPVMNGITMAEEIKKLSSKTPVIITTAYNDERFLLKAIDIGIDKYVKKPVYRDKVLEILDKTAETLLLKKKLHEAREKLRLQHEQLEEQYIVMHEDLAMAASFQQTLLPHKKELQRCSGLDIDFYLKPSSEVSGDFLIIEQIESSHLGIMVIDVMGHGIAAGLATIEMKAVFEEVKRTSLSPVVILREINKRVHSIRANEIFCAVTYAIYNCNTSKMTVASSGGLPFVRYLFAGDEASVERMDGDPLGLYDEDDFQISEKTYDVSPGDCFIIQTDGFLESYNDKDERFDDLATQKKVINTIKNKGNTANEIIDSLLQQVQAHRNGNFNLEDDATIVVVRKE